MTCIVLRFLDPDFAAGLYMLIGLKTVGIRPRFADVLIAGLEVLDRDLLAHLPQFGGKAIHDLHLHLEPVAERVVLVGGVHRAADVEDDVRGLLEKRAGDLRRPIAFVAPVEVLVVLPLVVLGELEHLV